jgi:hypothetical protein
MPPGGGGSLGDAAYESIAAYLLSANSATPGLQSLTTASTVQIATVATGVLSEAPDAAKGKGKGAPAVARGITVAFHRSPV